MTDALFSKSIKAGGKTYFFDVKQAQKGKQSKYIQLTESRLQEGQPRRSTITIFEDQIKVFVEAFDEVKNKIN